MAVISRGFVDALTESINMLSDATQRVVEMRLSEIAYVDTADLRNQVIAILEDILPVATKDAAGCAAESYDSIRELATGSANNAVANSCRVPKATERAVHGLIDKFEKNGFESFKRSILERCDYEIKRAAGECSLYNARRDSRKPRFARVPSGAETCTFCLMLASRGFVYHSEATAGLDHYHPNCDCRIVPGFDDMEIEGYDPDSLYDQWKEFERIDKLPLSGFEKDVLKTAYVNENIDYERVKSAIENHTIDSKKLEKYALSYSGDYYANS